MESFQTRQKVQSRQILVTCFASGLYHEMKNGTILNPLVKFTSTITETKKSRLEQVIDPLIHKFFRDPKFSEAQTGSPPKVSGTWRKNLVTKYRDISITHSFSIPETFRNTNKAAPRNFSWIQKFLTFSVIPCPKVHQNICTQQMESTTKFRGH